MVFSAAVIWEMNAESILRARMVEVVNAREVGWNGDGDAWVERRDEGAKRVRRRSLEDMIERMCSSLSTGQDLRVGVKNYRFQIN